MTRRSGLASALGWVLGFAIAFTAAGVGGRAALDAAKIEPDVTRHRVAALYREKVEHLTGDGRGGAGYRVAFLGDSMVVSYPEPFQIPHALQREVMRRGRGGPPIQISNLGLAGTGVFDYFLMADVIAELDPQLVVLGFDLTSPSREFQQAFSRPELAGWVDPGRIPKSLGLPLHWVGLTFDRLLFYVGVVQAGAIEPWVSLVETQTRFSRARERIEERLAIRGPRNRSPEGIYRGTRSFWTIAHNKIEGEDRYTEAAMRNHLGAALDGLPPTDPTIEMLGATVEAFGSFGIETFVYVSPINVEHIERLGLLDPPKLARTLDSVESAVRENGGHYLDLHALFPDAGFRDSSGHFAFEGEINGPAVVAARLASHVIRLSRGRGF